MKLALGVFRKGNYDIFFCKHKAKLRHKRFCFAAVGAIYVLRYEMQFFIRSNVSVPVSAVSVLFGHERIWEICFSIRQTFIMNVCTEINAPSKGSISQPILKTKRHSESRRVNEVEPFRIKHSVLTLPLHERVNCWVLAQLRCRGKRAIPLVCVIFPMISHRVTK